MYYLEGKKYINSKGCCRGHILTDVHVELVIMEIERQKHKQVAKTKKKNRKRFKKVELEHTTFKMTSKDKCNGDSPFQENLQDKNQSF